MLAENLIQVIDPTIKEYFDISEVGIELVDNTVNDPRVFEALGLSIRKLTDDVIMWWIGDWARLTVAANEATYKWLADSIWGDRYSPSKLERIAWTARNVPVHLRRADLSFGKHSLIAPEKYSFEQKKELLAYCADNNLGHNAFARYLGQDEEEQDHHYYESDQVHELEIELQQIRDKLQVTEEQVELQMQQYQARIRNIIDQLQVVVEYLQSVDAPDYLLDTLDNIQKEIKRT